MEPDVKLMAAIISAIYAYLEEEVESDAPQSNLKAWEHS